MKKKIINLFLIIILIITAFTLLNKNEKQLKEDEKNEPAFEQSIPPNKEDIKEKVITDNENIIYYDQEILNYIKQQYVNNNSINKDIKGWLYLKDYVNQPFADTPDNYQKYLRLNIYEQFSWNGIPFMSPSSKSTLNGNSLIYGHAMDNGDVFGHMIWLEDKDNFNKAEYLYVYDGFEDKFRIYELYTIFNVQDGQEFVQTKQFEYKDEKEYKEKQRKINKEYKERGFNNKDIESYTGNFLYLQKCAEYGNKLLRSVYGFHQILEI